MAKIGSTDLALVTARVHCCRLGAARLGFTPFDVKGAGNAYPCEYIWREVKPPTTQWTLVTEGVVCGKRPVAGFSMTGVSVPPAPLTGDITGTVYLDAEAPGNEVAAADVTCLAPVLADTTDIFGEFSFIGIAPGAITLLADKVGFIQGTNGGVVVAGQTTVINIVIFSPV